MTADAIRQLVRDLGFGFITSGEVESVLFPSQPVSKCDF